MNIPVFASGWWATCSRGAPEWTTLNCYGLAYAKQMGTQSTGIALPQETQARVASGHDAAAVTNQRRRSEAAHQGNHRVNLAEAVERSSAHDLPMSKRLVAVTR